MVQRVGSRIAAVTDLGYQWEFRVIQDDKQANAFALPGGKVAVYTGMLADHPRRGRPRRGAGPRDRPRARAPRR